MAARIIDGRTVAAEIRRLVAQEVADLRAGGVAPGLRVILVGDHAASLSYVGTKERVAREVGIDGAVERLPSSGGEHELLTRIEALNADISVHGILIQLPLPPHIDAQKIIEAVDPRKDVDGFHPMNAGRLSTMGRSIPPDLLVPCTPLGCLFLLESELGADGLSGKRALVVGRSNIVGKPMAQLLLAKDCTVTVAHSRTLDLAGECRQAEVLVAAIGRPEAIPGDWIAPGAIVVDVGINRVTMPDGKSRLVGDVAFASAIEQAGAITPVPGGVGPMTVACLLRNTVVAARAISRA